MNESGHDLFAGARFAGEQHRRLRLRDACSLHEDALPFLRLTDDAAAPSLRFKFACQRGYPRFKPRRRLARGRVPSRRLGEPLMRQRERKEIGDASGEVEVRFAEASCLPGEEEE